MPFLVQPVLPPDHLRSRAQPAIAVDEELLLRPWEPGDAAAVVEAFRDPAIQQWHVRRADSVDEAREWIAQWRDQWPAGTNAQWAVVRAASDDVVGRMSLREVALAEGRAELAYWTHPAARGARVAPRAAEALTRWAFDEGFHRLELVHAVANTASCRVAEKCGFRHEGTHRKALLHADGWHDTHLHARLAADG
ncbi:GNAT family N-acetyltransferase [Streptomyces sp. NPDC060194]|uniref:GNAT family N-acetyltransferase n=1 Tax=Streptomyces sp. NPDC060194 TaxID=3347069 RepID=UPI00365AF2CC